MRPGAHRLIRLISLLVFVGGAVLAFHRLSRTREQEDLTRFVESDVPKLRASEQPIEERVARLGRAPGLKPDEARGLLVDDLIPRLIRLRKQAEELAAQSGRTGETKRLIAEYLEVTDRLVEACRACVRVIDDPKLSQRSAVGEVRSRFDEVHRAYERWDEQVRLACARHRLAGPTRSAIREAR